MDGFNGKAALASVFFCLLATSAAAKGPKVVTSIMPIHALAAEVMAGVGAPELLVEGAASPHSFNLKPSDAQALEEADVVIWIGEGLEMFLQRPLANLKEETQVLTLSELEGIHLLPSRGSGLHDEHADDVEGHAHHDYHHVHGPVDPHLWLAPENGIIIANQIAETLVERDPDWADLYRENAQRMTRKLQALESRVQQKLLPFQGYSFLVFHDAYQYFEEAFGLRSGGSITLDAERQPGARRLREIRNWIGEQGPSCVFAEPQFEPRVLHMLVEGTEAQIGLLDPVGATLELGPGAYAALLDGLADGFVDCFAQQSR